MTRPKARRKLFPAVSMHGTHVESSLPSKPDPTNPVRDRLLFNCARLSAGKLKHHCEPVSARSLCSFEE